MDCTVKLNAQIYEDSTIARKSTCARTKTVAIVKSVLAPNSVDEVVSAIDSVRFYSIATDASNHDAEKAFPLITQYFTKVVGIQVNSKVHHFT